MFLDLPQKSLSNELIFTHDERIINILKGTNIIFVEKKLYRLLITIEE